MQSEVVVDEDFDPFADDDEEEGELTKQRRQDYEKNKLASQWRQ